jgi:hypothetical protein
MAATAAATTILSPVFQSAFNIVSYIPHQDAA